MTTLGVLPSIFPPSRLAGAIQFVRLRKVRFLFGIDKPLAVEGWNRLSIYEIHYANVGKYRVHLRSPGHSSIAVRLRIGETIGSNSSFLLCVGVITHVQCTIGTSKGLSYLKYTQATCEITQELYQDLRNVRAIKISLQNV